MTKLIFQHLIIMSFAVLLVSACIRNDVSTEIKILDIENGVKTGVSPLLSRYGMDIRYIPIQTDTAALLGDLNHSLSFIGDHYMAFIETITKKCKLFDKKGNYIDDIGTQGRGKGEYLYPDGLIIDETRKEVVIKEQNKLIIYNILDGAFRKEVSLDSFAGKYYKLTGISLLEKEKYAIGRIARTTARSSWGVINRQGEILYMYEEPETADTQLKTSLAYRTKSNQLAAIQLISSAELYYYDNHLYLLSPGNDTIFRFNDQYEKQPVYVKSFGKYKMQLDYDLEALKNIMLIRGASLRESSNALFFQLDLFSKSFDYTKPKSLNNYMFLDKETGVLSGVNYNSQFDMTGLLNDLDGGFPFWPSIISGDKMYQVVSAFKFIKLSEYCNSPRLKEIASTLTEDSNPVLIQVTQK